MPNPMPTTYPRLVRLIEDEFQRGIFQARRQLERQRVETYWRVGEYIDGYICNNKFNEEAQQVFFSDLARDVNRDRSFLKELRTFFLTYPELPRNDGLAWSHYRGLIQLPTKKERGQWERRIISEGIRCQDFGDLLRAENRKKHRDAGAQEAQVSPAVRSLACTRGRLYTYRVVSPHEIPWSQHSVVVDTGFDGRLEVRVETEPAAALFGGHIVVSHKEGDGYTVKRTDTRVEELYTYKAYLDRVVDGDTILANIDCGFHSWSHKDLRFFGINAPELSEPGGGEAKRFVQRTLETCSFFVVKTYRDRQEKYGRYLADVFFKPGETDGQRVADEGKHLNQLLLDEGLAGVYGM